MSNPDIPKWFDLQKYDKSKLFNKNDWFEQFSIRFFLYLVEVDQLKSDYARSLFDAIKIDIYPNNSAAVLAHMMTIPFPTMHVITQDDSLFQKNLWSTTIDEMIKLPRVSPDEISNNSDLYKPLDSLYIKDDIFGRNHLTVDLNATFEDLESDFKLWLKEAKYQFDANEKRHIINSNHERLWSQHRVLAYLDLLIWCRFNDYEIKNHGDITNQLLVQWVFDDRHPEGVTREKIRNVKRYVKEMMNFNFMIRLFKYCYGTNQHESLVNIVKKFCKQKGINPSSLNQ